MKSTNEKLATIIPSIREILKKNPSTYSINDLRNEVNLIRSYLDILGYRPYPVSAIKWNKRYTKTLGNTRRSKTPGTNNWKYELSFNYKYFQNEEASQLHDTIIHECIHLCDDCFNHGYLFKQIANHFNVVFGTNIERLNKNASQYFEFLSKTQQGKKYEVYCEDCGRYLGTRKRITQSLLSIARKEKTYQCPYCRTSNMRVTNLTQQDLCKPIVKTIHI